MSLPKVYREDNCLYLIQDLRDMDTYERAKAIVNFCDKETKQFEKEIDRAILEIFEKYNINVHSTDKRVLKQAFALLKDKGVEIEIKDNYKEMVELYNSTLIKDTKLFSIWLEDDTTLQCGVYIKEHKLSNYKGVEL